MADGPASTIVFDGDSTGAVAALHAVDVAAKNTAASVKGTGAALGSIGDGADAGVNKAVAATSRFEAQLKRLNLELESGGRNTAAYIEGRAKLAGADTAALAPLIAQYDQLKAKQTLANSEFTKAGKVMTEYGMTVKGTSAALRQVPAQFTDIIVSLQGGQAPLTVLLQQGGQLKDVFGGVGNAAKALGGYILGLVNPFTVVAGTVGVVGLAAYRASEDVKALRTALILTGTQSTTSLSNLDATAAGLTKLGVSSAASSEALVAFISAGAKVDSRLQDITKTAIDLEKFGGAAVAETAKKFVALAKDPLADFDRLTIATYSQIEALLEQGRRVDAVTLAQSAFNEANKETAKSLAAMEGPLDYSIRWWKELGVSVWDAAKGMATALALRPKTGDEERGGLQKRRDLYAAQGYDTTKEDARLAYFKQIDAAQKGQNANLAKEIELKNLLSKFNEQDTAGKKQRELNQGVTDYSKLLAAGQISVEQYTAAIKKLSEVKEAKAGKTGLSEAEKANAAAVKADIAGAKEMERLKTKFDGDEMKRIADLAEAKAKAFAKSAEAYSKELDARAIANADQERSAYDYAQSVEEGIKRTEFEIGLMGKTETARAIALGQYEIELRLQKQILEVKKSIADESVKDQAIAGLNATAIREKAAVANRVMVDEFKKTSDSINSTLTDALMRGFESGKDFARNLRDTVVNMFKTMVLRPIISAVMSPISGAIGGALGFSGAAQAGQAGGGVMDAVNSAGSFYNMLNGGVTNAITSGFGKLASSSVGQSLGLSTTSGVMGPATAGGAAPTMLTEFGATASSWASAIGGTMAGIAMGSMAKKMISGGYSTGKGMDTFQNIGIAVGSAIGGPVLGAIIGAGAGVFNRAFGRKLKDSGIEGSFGGQEGFSGNSYEFMKGGWFRSDKTNRSPLDADVQKGLADQFKGLQVSSALMAQTLGLSAESVAGFTANIKLSFKDLTEAQINENLALEFGKISDSLAQGILGSYKETVATVIDEIISGGGGEAGDITYSQVSRQVKTSTYTPSEFARDGETASATLSRLSTSIIVTNSWLSMLRNRLFDVSLSGASAASSLADAFGGLDKLSASSAEYYGSFYSEAERAAASTENLAKQLALVNIAMPESKAAFRDVVDGLDLTTDAGRKAYAAMLTLAPEFASTTDAIEALAVAAAESLIKTFTGNGKLTPALNTAELAIGDFTNEATKMSGELTFINSIMGDSTSAVIGFSDGAYVLGTAMSASQKSAKILEDQIYALGRSADKSVIDFDGLSFALLGINTKPAGESIASANAYFQKINVLPVGASIETANAYLKALNALPVGTSISDANAYLSGIKALPVGTSIADVNSYLTAVNALPVGTSIADVNKALNSINSTGFGTSLTSANQYLQSINVLPLGAAIEQANSYLKAFTALPVGTTIADANAYLSGVKALPVGTSIADVNAYLKAINALPVGAAIADVNKALNGVDTEVFVATLALVFDNLAARIGAVVDSIKTERVAVREAALSIINPTVMSKVQIQRGIDAIGVTMPSNADVMSANSNLVKADAESGQRSNWLANANSQLSVQISAQQQWLAYLSVQRQANATHAAAMDAMLLDLSDNRESAAKYALISEATASKNISLSNIATIDAQARDAATAVDGYAATIAANTAAVNAQNNAAQTAALRAAKQAAVDYTKAIQSFAIEAGTSVTKLSRLREETVKYYESQKALADLMMSSASGLRSTVAGYRFSQLSEEGQYQSLASQFSTAYSQSQGVGGEKLAGIGDTINSLLNPLIESLNSTGRAGQISNYLAQAESVAALIESATPVDYQADSLKLLGDIDTRLVSLQDASLSAETIIAGAVKAGSEKTAEGLRAVIAAITGSTVPAFAAGGMHAGGIRLVGENGPELEVTGPSRIYNANQTRGMMGGNTDRLEALVERQGKQLEAMSFELRAIASSTGKTAKTLERVTPDGESLQTTAVA